MKRAKTVAGYIAAAPKEIRGKLREMRTCIRKAAPGVKEDIKWGMPSFSYHRIVVQFAYFKDHVSIFPGRVVIKKFAKNLSKLKTSAGTVRFPFDKPLPLPLIKKITVFRAKAIKETDAKWKTKK